MAMPKILDWLDDLVAKVATNTTNIANNKKTIEDNKKLFDEHTADDNRHWTTTDRQNFDRVVHFKGYYVTIDKLKEAYPTGQLGDYAIVGGTDTVWLWDDETNSWVNSTEQGIVISVNGRTGEVILTKTDVGLSNVDNTSDKNKPLSTASQNALNAKADRKKITLDEADGLTLKAGVYDLIDGKKTILNFTSNYWTVIVGQQDNQLRQLYGDINGDGVIDQADIDLMEEFINEIKTPTAAQKLVADLNGDGIINNKDLNLLYGYVINGVPSDIIGTPASATTEVIRAATQIWMNYGSDEVPHIYVRKQEKQSSWSEFKEILTNVHLVNLQNQITENAEHIATNTTDISNLKINKANRGNITLDQANATTGLQAGIYALENVTVTLAGVSYTNQYFNVIICDWTDRGTIKLSSQIWLPFSSGAATTAYIRHQTMSSDNTTRVWGDFIKIANSTQINNLQSQINTNKTNITGLTNEKADRKRATLADLETNNLRAGMYFCRESKTILGVTSDYWNIIINEQNSATDLSGLYSASQIWITSETETPYHIFFRKHIQKTSWGDFVEIYTTSDMSKDDISKFKQYKGYFETAFSLKTAFKTATNGDYAIVGSALYIWNSKQSTWTEVSGSGGGSTGTNKWSIKQYSVPAYTKQVIPQFKDIVGKTLDRQWEIEDTDDYLLNEAKNNNKCYLFETYVNMEEALEFSSTTMAHNDGINVFVNNRSIYSSAVVGNTSTISIPVVVGWNKIQILLCEVNGDEAFKLGIKFTSSDKCLGMDCYHAETEPTQGYVPLMGNSTVEGTLTINKIATPSNELVSNLNADLLDGKHATDFAAATDFADLTTQVNTNTGNILENAKKIQANTEQIGTNKDDITNLKTKMATAETNIKTNTTDIAALKTKTDTTNTNVTNLTARVKTNEDNIVALKTKTDTTNTNVTNLTSKVNTNAGNIKTNADDIAALKTKTDATNDNVAANTANIDKILEGTATIPSVSEAENAKNADKLGGQLPSYYAAKTDLSKYLPLTGGTLTGKTTILGTAASKSFWVRGITGCSTDGNTEDALYLNYDNQQPVYINGAHLVYHSGNIPIASTTTSGIVKLNNTRTSTSTTEAATANAVKDAYDTLNTALTNHKDDTEVHLTAADRTILTKANKFKGYFETETALNTAFPTGEAGDYAIVNTTDTVWIWDVDKEGGAGWKDGAGKGSVISVNNMTGEVVLTKSNIGLGNVDNTSDANKPVSTAQQAALDKKVDKAGDTMTGNLTVLTGATNEPSLCVSNGTKNIALMIGAGGTNRGIYDKQTRGWMIYKDSDTSLRTDLSFHVGNTGDSTASTNGGAIFDGGIGVAKAINAGTTITAATIVTAGTDLKTKSGIVNFNDKAQIKYNATDECIEFIFN